MRLLQGLADGGVCLRDPCSDNIPDYAILSHTWLADDAEVSMQDMVAGKAPLKGDGYKKIMFCIEQAARDGLQFCWVDTCCIDKSSSAELQEAITTMFSWYHNAARCYVYLSDVSTAGFGPSDGDAVPQHAWEASFRKSRWFSRGWTLQELLAPRSVEFFSAQGVRLGSKTSLEALVHQITGIPVAALRGADLSTFSIAERLSWAEARQTKRLEDNAYSLLGIFNIFIPLLYGEGHNAMARLHKKILKRYPRDTQQTELLSRLPCVEQAAFNAINHQYASTCLPGTRVELLRELAAWIDGSDRRRIFWLSGVAGTGKSTVARTIASKYHDQGSLGGSFFFSRGGGELSSADKLITTIAWQLATRIPGLKSYICKAVLEDKNIAAQSYRDQWDRLILQPLDKFGSMHPTKTILIVLDALDECNGEKDIRIIIRLLGSTRSLKDIRLRVLVTSRPEIPVRCGFSQIPESERQIFVLQDILPAIVDGDLGRFFEHSFATIREERGFDGDWPGMPIVKRLVEISSGLFIWAATACRFIREGRRLAMKRIFLLINRHNLGDGPEKQLDEIYGIVLGGSIYQGYNDDEKKELYGILRGVVGGIAILFSPLSIGSLSHLLSLPPSDINGTLADLHTIFNIPSRSDQPIRLHHPTFRDFIFNKDRCTDTNFLVDERRAHQTMAENCIRLMSKHLKRDMCGLRSPGILARDVDPAKLKLHIPPELEYACRYWVQHCREGGLNLCDGDAFHQFCERHFLHWLEVMSLTGHGAEVAGVIRMYSSLLVPEENKAQFPLVQDARRLVFSFQSIIHLAPLQAYCAALAFVPRANTFRGQFWGEMRHWITNVKLAEAVSNKVGRPVTTRTFFVNDMEFTPDGTRLASGAVDEVVRLWDVASKAKAGVLDGPRNKVSSVSISPDGRLIAGASDDATVRIWDLETRNLRFTLHGHSRWVNSVMFSPDSRLVVSGSMDETVRIWSAESGQRVMVLEGSLSCINSVAFRPDGRAVAASSTDQVVRIWDVEQQQLSQLLDGHTAAVNSIRYSPDGRLIISGADDMTVKIWDVETETVRMTLQGHQRRVMTVSTSADGRLIASGSEDMTIMLWDASSGVLLGTLRGHTSGINAVAFSPDSRLLASSSFNDEVRLWDTKTGEALGDFDEFGPEDIPSLGEKLKALQLEADAAAETALKGHSAAVIAVTSSLDGQLVATGSHDGTIKIWTREGAQKCLLEGHSDSINSIAFSLDAETLASASADNKVKVWSTSTGCIRYTVESHTDNVRIVRFSVDDKYLASCSTDKTAIIWEARSGLLRHRLEGHSDTVNDVVFSPVDSQIVATCSADMTARVWRTSSNGEPVALVLRGHSDTINSISISPDGALLISASADATVRIWKTDGTPMGVLRGHVLPVNSAAFSPDNKLIVSCSDDKTVRIWDADTQLERALIEQPEALRAVRFSPCSHQIETDRGLLDLSPTMSASRDDLAPALFVSKDWVTMKGERMLWLPAEYQAICVDASAGSAILGHATGGVSFLHFKALRV